ncbi:DNA translocase FtsK [Sulfuriflexus mobilis]|uniref:DNA translocase FtsK n=1 Tax=Sulfuriflexus mobilis TaxID=1811807 RepID=UPI000F82A3A1|nr:DNA translocase FtsK [Sulfuriflexus mobilis]
MAQAKRTQSTANESTINHHRGLREGSLLVLGAIGVYLLLCLLTYKVSDPGWSHSASQPGSVNNAGGIAGALFADIFLYLFGLMAYLFPIMVVYSGWLLFQGRNLTVGFNTRQFVLRAVGFLLTLGAGAGLATLHVQQPELALPLNPGGILGDLAGNGLVGLFSFLGATLFLLALFLTGVTLFTGLSWFRLMDVTGKYTLMLLSLSREQAARFREYLQGRRARIKRNDTVEVVKRRIETRKPPRIEPVVILPEPGVRAERERQVPLFDTADDTPLPPLSLLDLPKVVENKLSNEALEAMSRLVELKLQDFGVEVEVVAVHPGPVITRFELQPAPGLKASKISNLDKDLARAMSIVSVRVVEVIPGKSVIGLEVPNEIREIVRLREIVNSKEYESHDSKLSLAMGKDIAGYPVVVDLAKMPHLLVAGTTGSGKSVAINAMILSLLYNATPHDVRLIMVDPKMLELSIYEGIPHLLTPVVTDMKDAANALRWCVAEMERRYKLMAALGVRHLTSYNRKVKEAIDRGEPIPDPTFVAAEGLDEEAPMLEHLPFIVVIIDELADMMMMVGKKVEELIARLAQKARASGIHLILATQRPSVDVITGLIKANIPTRVAFQVSTKIDSRTILDQGGAEQLLGHGDMLYMAPGTGVPTRIHGAFVSDEEVHKVVDNLKSKGEPDYLDAITSESSGDGVPGLTPSEGGSGDEMDPLYDQAVAIITESRRASISGLQRRLKVGYNRAARMIEEMELAGVVSEVQSNGQREVIAPRPPKG